MSKLDLEFDSTGDIVITDDGDFSFTNSATAAVRFQISEQLGDWVGDPTAGTRLFNLGGMNITNELAEEIKDARAIALKELESAGMISDITVISERAPNGRLLLRTTCVDLYSSNSITIESGDFGG